MYLGNKTGVAKIADRLIIFMQLVNTNRLITDVISVDLEMFAVLIFFFHGLRTLAYHGVNMYHLLWQIWLSSFF